MEDLLYLFIDFKPYPSAKIIIPGWCASFFEIKPRTGLVILTKAVDIGYVEGFVQSQPISSRKNQPMASGVCKESFPSPVQTKPFSRALP